MFFLDLRKNFLLTAGLLYLLLTKRDRKQPSPIQHEKFRSDQLHDAHNIGYLRLQQKLLSLEGEFLLMTMEDDVSIQYCTINSPSALNTCIGTYNRISFNVATSGSSDSTYLYKPKIDTTPQNRGQTTKKRKNFTIFT